MAATKTFVLLVLLYTAGIAIVDVAAQDPNVTFSAGQLFDIITAAMNMGLTNIQANPPSGTGPAPPPPQFQLFNPKYNRFIFLTGSTPFADRTEALGSVVPLGTLFTLQRIPETGFVALTPDGLSALGNGALTGGELYTSGATWFTEFTNQYAIRSAVSPPNVSVGVLLQNRGNGQCVSLDARNKNPVTIQPCSGTDDKQRWQLCQAVTGGTGNTCWPQTANPMLAKGIARRAVSNNNDE